MMELARMMFKIALKMIALFVQLIILLSAAPIIKHILMRVNWAVLQIVAGVSIAVSSAFKNAHKK